MDRVEDLRADYERLGELLQREEGAAAAAIARERRLIRDRLVQLEGSEEVSKTDELAARRSKSDRPPSRRKSGRG